jgi:hypothetical protein
MNDNAPTEIIKIDVGILAIGRRCVSRKSGDLNGIADDPLRRKIRQRSFSMCFQWKSESSDADIGWKYKKNGGACQYPFTATFRKGLLVVAV